MPEVATRTIELGGGRYAPTAARLALDAWGPLALLEEYRHVRLLASELVANSVLGLPPDAEAALELEVSLSPQAVRVELKAPAGGLEWNPLDEEEQRVSGWRLYLLTALAQRWGIERGRDVRVWFEVDRQAPEVRPLERRERYAGRRDDG